MLIRTLSNLRCSCIIWILSRLLEFWLLDLSTLLEIICINQTAQKVHSLFLFCQPSHWLVGSMLAANSVDETMPLWHLRRVRIFVFSEIFPNDWRTFVWPIRAGFHEYTHCCWDGSITSRDVLDSFIAASIVSHNEVFLRQKLQRSLPSGLHE